MKNNRNTARLSKDIRSLCYAFGYLTAAARGEIEPVLSRQRVAAWLKTRLTPEQVQEELDIGRKEVEAYLDELQNRFKNREDEEQLKSLVQQLVEKVIVYEVEAKLSRQVYNHLERLAVQVYNHLERLAVKEVDR